MGPEYRRKLNPFAGIQPRKLKEKPLFPWRHYREKLIQFSLSFFEFRLF